MKSKLALISLVRSAKIARTALKGILSGSMNMKTALRAMVTSGAILSYPLVGLVRSSTGGDLSVEEFTCWLNPALCLFIAGLLVAAWMIAALLRWSGPSHILMVLAAVLYLFLYHIASEYPLRCEINIRRVVLGRIDAHLRTGEIPEVRRAIRIHDEVLGNTGDARLAAQELLHELNRATD